MQLSGIAQHGLMNIGLKAAEGRQPYHRQNDAEKENGCLLPVLAQFADDQFGQHAGMHQ